MNIIQRTYFTLRVQLGFDPRAMYRFILSIPRYILDYIQLRRKYKGPIRLLPCLHDRSDEGGATKSEYFWQDLLVARLIYAANPIKHVDIGSRWDGFVGHVASFRQLEVFDVRPVSTSIPGVIFRQADLMNPVTDMIKCSDSVSCLHTLEHLGLGRYGDTIDVAGSENGFKNIASLLKEDGTLYLSVPVGQERVEFNANRVFDPRTIIRWATNLSLVLSSLIVIRNGHQIETVEHPEAKLAALAQEQYALGLFVFRKV